MRERFQLILLSLSIFSNYFLRSPLSLKSIFPHSFWFSFISIPLRLGPNCSIKRMLYSSLIIRYLVSSLILALKFNEDNVLDNDSLASILKISLDQINSAEKNHLSAVGYKLWVEPKLFSYYEKYVIEYAKDCL